MAIIKNIHKLLLNEQDLTKLEAAAGMHKRYSNIEFKIIKVDDESLTIQTLQGKHLSRNYADQKMLIQRTKELFSNFIAKKIHVHALVFQENQISIVTDTWLLSQMKNNDIRIVDLVDETGIDKSNISAWAKGLRPMSQIVKAMFYFYFESKQKSGNYKIKDDALLTVIK